MTHPTISVTPSDLFNKQHAITLASRPDVLARMAGNPVPKWSGK